MAEQHVDLNGESRASRRELWERRLTRAFFFAGMVLLILVPLGLAAGRYRGRSVEPARIPVSHLAPQLSGRYVVLVVFQPRDCAGYQGFIDSMGSLAASRPGLVLGVPVNAPREREALRTALADFAPSFPLVPVLADDATRLLGATGYRTPVAVVVDPQGRPALIASPQPDTYGQAEMTRLLASYLARLEAGVST